jgi:glycosyltransferase involved in cell wall biosynthesis
VLPALLEGNDKHIIIAGITTSESYKQKILLNAKNHGVSDRVHFTGPISENDKQWYLKNCLAFVFPSLTEGFGLPVVEAMYFGVPIFLSKYTSLPEIGGEVCYYFDSFKKIDMQHTIQQGLQHYSSTNAKEKIQNRSALFNWKKAAIKYLEIYRSFD